MPISDLLIILKWYLLITLIGFSCIPLTIKLFPSFLDKGYIFSKALGLGILTYIIFLLASFHILSFSKNNLVLILISLTIFNYIFIKIKTIDFKQIIKISVLEEFIFLTSLLIWSYIRGTSPDVHGLEKFMDFGFMNSALRSDYFPAKDMWLTPFSINYYYFGHLIIAALTKISQIKSGIVFNLSIAAMFAFTFTESFSIGLNLVFKVKNKLSFSIIAGIVCAFFVSLGGNLQTIYAFFQPYNGDNPLPFWNLFFSPNTFPNSYWYPNATRFIFHTIHEFPIYSFVVSDLHAHILSLPFVFLIIAILLNIFNEGIKKSYLLLISFTLAILYMTNTWDIVTYFLLTIFVFLFIFWKNKNISQLIIDVALLVATTFVLILPFSLTFKPFSQGIGILCAPQFLISISKIGPFIFESNHCQISPLWQLFILYGFFIFWSVSFFIFLKNRSTKIISTDYFVILLTIVSTILILLPEFIYIKDIYSAHYRANTMFKFTYQAFIMLQISSAYIFFRIFYEIKKNRIIRIQNLIITLFGIIFLFLIFSYPNFAINSYYNNLKNYIGIDGQKYLENLYPEDYKAISWINKNIKGQPVILEAHGDSYTDYERISSNTGLPTVLGWTVHEWLWRGSYDIPAKRIPDIFNLYESSNMEITKKLIEKYNISYVYIGRLEHQKYPNLNEQKFEELGKLIFQSGRTKIYKLNY